MKNQNRLLVDRVRLVIQAPQIGVWQVSVELCSIVKKQQDNQ
jgi:hypothetical protein